MAHPQPQIYLEVIEHNAGKCLVCSRPLKPRRKARSWSTQLHQCGWSLSGPASNQSQTLLLPPPPPRATLSSGGRKTSQKVLLAHRRSISLVPALYWFIFSILLLLHCYIISTVVASLTTVSRDCSSLHCTVIAVHEVARPV